MEAEVFAQVDLSGKEEPSGADLILEGAIWTSSLEETYYTYCISVLAAPLWVLGLPLGRTRVIFSGYCRIVEPTSRRILWDAEFQKSWTTLGWIYYRQTWPTMRELAGWAANEMVLDLDQAALEGRFR